MARALPYLPRLFPHHLSLPAYKPTSFTRKSLMHEFRDGIQKDGWSKTSGIEPRRGEECGTGSISDLGLGQETS
jgi:hypothetical protein